MKDSEIVMLLSALVLIAAGSVSYVLSGGQAIAYVAAEDTTPIVPKQVKSVYWRPAINGAYKSPQERIEESFYALEKEKPPVRYEWQSGRVNT